MTTVASEIGGDDELVRNVFMLAMQPGGIDRWADVVNWHAWESTDVPDGFTSIIRRKDTGNLHIVGPNTVERGIATAFTPMWQHDDRWSTPLPAPADLRLWTPTPTDAGRVVELGLFTIMLA